MNPNEKKLTVVVASNEATVAQPIFFKEISNVITDIEDREGAIGRPKLLIQTTMAFLGDTSIIYCSDNAMVED